jgi:hypothetical protein
MNPQTAPNTARPEPKQLTTRMCFAAQDQKTL